MRLSNFSSKVASGIGVHTKNLKAPEDWRSPKRFAWNRRTAQRASVLECGGPLPLFWQPAVTVMILFLALGATAQSTNALSDAQIQGRQLAQQILKLEPAGSFTNSGTMEIRNANGDWTNFPVNCETIVTPAEWVMIYAATSGPPASESKLTITHVIGQPNEYVCNSQSGQTFPSGNELMRPFAGSDYWIADLGLDFFHWPEQKIVKKELMRGRGCKVLESTNPNPSPGGYSRVVSWIDEETLGIVHAEAYDTNGKLLKEFDPKSFKKVKGHWELQDIEIRNVQTDTRTRIEFNLK
jgi:hypothetical protein